MNSESPLSVFSARLTELMEKHETRVIDLASIISRERKYVSQLRNGKSTPGIYELALIARHYGVTTDYLIGMDVLQKVIVKEKPKPPEPTKEPVAHEERTEALVEPDPKKIGPVEALTNGIMKEKNGKFFNSMWEE